MRNEEIYGADPNISESYKVSLEVPNLFEYVILTGGTEISTLALLVDLC